MTWTDSIRDLVRPLVTMLLVATFCGIAAWFAFTHPDKALEAAALIGGPSGFVLEKWFESKRKEREVAGNA